MESVSDKNVVNDVVSDVAIDDSVVEGPTALAEIRFELSLKGDSDGVRRLDECSSLRGEVFQKQMFLQYALLQKQFDDLQKVNVEKKAAQRCCENSNKRDKGYYDRVINNLSQQVGKNLVAGALSAGKKAVTKFVFGSDGQSSSSDESPNQKELSEMIHGQIVLEGKDCETETDFVTAPDEHKESNVKLDRKFDNFLRTIEDLPANIRSKYVHLHDSVATLAKDFGARHIESKVGLNWEIVLWLICALFLLLATIKVVMVFRYRRFKKVNFEASTTNLALLAEIFEIVAILPASSTLFSVISTLLKSIGINIPTPDVKTSTVAVSSLFALSRATRALDRNQDTLKSFCFEGKWEDEVLAECSENNDVAIPMPKRFRAMFNGVDGAFSVLQTQLKTYRSKTDKKMLEDQVSMMVLEMQGKKFTHGSVPTDSRILRDFILTTSLSHVSQEKAQSWGFKDMLEFQDTIGLFYSRFVKLYLLAFIAIHASSLRIRDIVDTFLVYEVENMQEQLSKVIVKESKNKDPFSNHYGLRKDDLKTFTLCVSALQRDVAAVKLDDEPGVGDWLFKRDWTAFGHSTKNVSFSSVLRALINTGLVLVFVPLVCYSLYLAYKVFWRWKDKKETHYEAKDLPKMSWRPSAHANFTISDPSLYDIYSFDENRYTLRNPMTSLPKGKWRLVSNKSGETTDLDIKIGVLPSLAFEGDVPNAPCDMLVLKNCETVLGRAENAKVPWSCRSFNKIKKALDKLTSQDPKISTRIHGQRVKCYNLCKKSIDYHNEHLNVIAPDEPRDLKLESNDQQTFSKKPAPVVPNELRIASGEELNRNVTAILTQNKLVIPQASETVSQLESQNFEDALSLPSNFPNVQKPVFKTVLVEGKEMNFGDKELGEKEAKNLAAILKGVEAQKKWLACIQSEMKRIDTALKTIEEPGLDKIEVEKRTLAMESYLKMLLAQKQSSDKWLAGLEETSMKLGLCQDTIDCYLKQGAIQPEGIETAQFVASFAVGAFWYLWNINTWRNLNDCRQKVAVLQIENVALTEAVVLLHNRINKLYSKLLQSKNQPNLTYGLNDVSQVGHLVDLDHPPKIDLQANLPGSNRCIDLARGSVGGLRTFTADGHQMTEAVNTENGILLNCHASVQTSYVRDLKNERSFTVGDKRIPIKVSELELIPGSHDIAGCLFRRDCASPKPGDMVTLVFHGRDDHVGTTPGQVERIEIGPYGWQAPVKYSHTLKGDCGCRVLNEAGKVVGLHFGSTEGYANYFVPFVPEVLDQIFGPKNVLSHQ